MLTTKWIAEPEGRITWLSWTACFVVLVANLPTSSRAEGGSAPVQEILDNAVETSAEKAVLPEGRIEVRRRAVSQRQG